MAKIAIIEDSRESNDEYKHIVLDLWPECVVHQWYCVSEAIDAIKNNEYDIVISDIDLGSGTDAQGATKIINAIDVQVTPVLIVSGVVDVEKQRLFYRSLEVWDYLQKPFASDDLKVQLKRAMIVRKSITGELVVPSEYSSPDPNLEINFRRKSLVWKGHKIVFPQTKMDILEVLLKSPNQYIVYNDLIKLLPSGKNKESLRVHMGEIKREFESVDPDFTQIKTKQMVGYGWILESN